MYRKKKNIFYFFEIRIARIKPEVLKSIAQSLLLWLWTLICEHGHQTCDIYLKTAPENGVKYVYPRRCISEYVGCLEYECFYLPSTSWPSRWARPSPYGGKHAEMLCGCFSSWIQRTPAKNVCQKYIYLSISYFKDVIAKHTI